MRSKQEILETIHNITDARLAQLEGRQRPDHEWGRAPHHVVVMGTLTPVQPVAGGVTGGLDAARLQQLRDLNAAGLLSAREQRALARLEQESRPGVAAPGPVAGTLDRRQLAVPTPRGYAILTPTDPAWGLVEELRKPVVKLRKCESRGPHWAWRMGTEADRARWEGLAERLLTLAGEAAA